MCYSDTKIVLAVVGKSRSVLQVSNLSNAAADNKRWQQMKSRVYERTGSLEHLHLVQSHLVHAFLLTRWKNQSSFKQVLNKFKF